MRGSKIGIGALLVLVLLAPNVTSSDTTLGTVSPSSLVFTPANWNVPQTVIVTGVASSVARGNLPYQIVFAQATSGDPNYVITAPPVSVTNMNGNTKGVVITQQSGGTAVVESGPSTTYSINLNSQPTAAVTITLGTDFTQLSLSPTSRSTAGQQGRRRLRCTGRSKGGRGDG